MSAPAKIWHDWIDAVFRPVIAFFVGVAMGYVAKLAEVSGWWVALGISVIILVGAAFILFIDRVLRNSTDRFFDWTIGLKYPGGIKPAKTKQRAHWFVRYGWIFGLLLGVSAVFFLPAEVLEWLL